MSGSPMCSKPSRWWRKIQSPEITGQVNTRFEILPLCFKSREPNRRRCLNVPSKLIRILSIPASKASVRPPLVLLRAVAVAAAAAAVVVAVAAVAVVVVETTKTAVRWLASSTPLLVGVVCATKVNKAAAAAVAAVAALGKELLIRLMLELPGQGVAAAALLAGAGGITRLKQ